MCIIIAVRDLAVAKDRRHISGVVYSTLHELIVARTGANNSEVYTCPAYPGPNSTKAFLWLSFRLSSPMDLAEASMVLSISLSE